MAVVASAPAPAPIIELRSVSVSRGGELILQDVSLRLEERERLAVAGPNGAGKTTLLRTITGLERTAKGSVAIFGRECKKEKDFRAVRPDTGFLFQDSDDQIFCPTVAEDVAFGPLNRGVSPKEARGQALATLEKMELLHLADKITNHLSGGEKRLVCLAGLLAMEPRVLLLDEPTNGLDGKHEERLVAILKDLNTSMIIVSHDMRLLADMASRALLLENGRITDAVIHRHPHVHDHVHIHPVGKTGHEPDTPSHGDEEH